MTNCRPISRWWLAFLSSWALFSASAMSQDLSDEEPPEFVPGLVAEIELQSGKRLQRLDDDILFDWNAQSVDHRVERQEPIKIRWSGFLECKESGEFKVHVHTAGRFRVRIDDRYTVLGESVGEAARARWFDSQPMELNFGRHSIEIEYASSESARQIGLYWSGPQFELEPISQRYYSHRSEVALDGLFERGEQLHRALRCSACHSRNDVRRPMAAPALTHLDGNLNHQWLMERLMSTASDPSQRMPHFGLDKADAEAIALALFDASLPSVEPKAYVKPKPVKVKKDEPTPRVEPSVAEGRAAFLSLGCLACHQLDELGERSLFDGGDLSSLMAKRTADFSARWLEDPSSVNADHRMPVFQLEPLQRADLTLFLQSLGKPANQAVNEINADRNSKPDVLLRGTQLLAKHRCAACHTLPKELQSDVKRTALGSSGNWDGGCLQASDATRSRPGFGLSKMDRAALKEYWMTAEPMALAKVEGRQLMLEQNCVACHARDAAVGLAKTLAKLATIETEIAPRLAGLAPPSLTGVGDKLHEAALAGVVTGRDPLRRPWLDVRMPKFQLSEDEVEAIVSELVAHDRIPGLQTVAPELPVGKATELAAARLVTAEGFGCQSCHKIGSAEPPKVAINAHGTDLTMLGDRIRPSWFRRWVHNPSRIVPRMEMPAILVPAKGILHDDLDMQLAALWKTLNTPGFEPPKPNPVRVVRNFNIAGQREHANVLTDVLETSSGKFLRPLLVGLPNRHNLLFDLESGRLASWWIGDTARQYTRGKSWYWEVGASSIVENLKFIQQFYIVDSRNRVWKPKTRGQFVVQFDGLRHIENGVEWQGRVELWHDDGQSRLVQLTQRMVAIDASGVEVMTALSDLQAEDQVAIEVPPAVDVTERAGLFRAELNEYATATWRSPLSLRVEGPQQLRLAGEDASGGLQWSTRLSTTLPGDRFQPVDAPVAVARAEPLDVVPGYAAVQLPLPRNEMPTAFAWRAAGAMFVASLKGRVLKVIDTDGDGLEDSFEAISDDLPAPYGLAVNSESLDVLCKTSLIRLSENDSATMANVPYSQSVVADGWGYTSDYHDWAVGLQRDADGGYYMALPCQQDDRSEAAANLRGQALKLIPYNSGGSPRKYRIETVAAGLRFPMGLALNSGGELFATDNQGNYNPFNELNHIQFGKRYGFINKLDARPGFSPAFESPAVNLPHPWTRSVNGLCFLDTPSGLSNGGKTKVFGAFEGDLIGCEYNGLSLIRMSLQKVGGQYQGAAYAFSRSPKMGETTFEGPVCCAVAPNGDLFIGSIHDSGWGGGQNTGSIVRLQANRELPLGIDEVRATPTGFEITFTQSVDSELALNGSNYSIRSYRRVSTPAYGGDDQDERSEPVRELKIASDLKTVTLKLNELRAGCVYEINVGSVGVGEAAIFPSQAHYNMREVPGAKE